MDNKLLSSSAINDIIGTLIVVAIVASLLSFALDEHSLPQSSAQSTSVSMPLSTVAHFSPSKDINVSELDVSQLSQCQVVSVHPTKAIVMLDCSKQNEVPASKQI